MERNSLSSGGFSGMVAHLLAALHQSRSELETGPVQRGCCGECELDSFKRSVLAQKIQRGQF